ncbi:hypothetical protein L873DRAFT_1846536 [Choiromyces venosus 120613-1]|uniref:Uncharacterized protein n=1 Tax=Choiromyces venosus 120613-1 TaxID=1336337 RepID=A0A3N4J8L3_9PEZI|nr:hypothetical protein L873DRAFT_1846536 [Choiromyces venosus 120613-1]
MVQFKLDGTWTILDTLLEGEKPIVFITHDESTFNVNDDKRRIWKEEGKQPLRAKSRGKEIMVSGFLTPGGRLKVPDTIPDEELLQDHMWPKRGSIPIRDAMEFLEYGKNNYWTRDKMVHHMMQIALPIFQVAFPGCQALFAFNNASNHSCYAPNALLASKMNQGPGGGQPLMRDGFIHSKHRLQSMVYPENHSNNELRGKAKGLEQVLKERGLWKKCRSNGFPFLLKCPTSNNRLGRIVSTPLMASEKPFPVPSILFRQLLFIGTFLPACVSLMHIGLDSTMAQQSFANGFTKVTAMLRTKQNGSVTLLYLRSFNLRVFLCLFLRIW